MPKTKAEIQRDYEKRTGYAAQAKWDKENTRMFRFKVMRKTEAEILEKLESVPNISGYIKQLILSDIEKEKEKE